MVTSQAVSAKVKETVGAATQALDSENSMIYGAFDQHIRELEAMAREAFQAKLKHDYQLLLDKLENDQPLTGSEMDMLKLLIVGEAKYYLKHENDLENWQNELARLAKELERVESTGLDDIDSLLHMQALCRDARNVLPDITFYFREKERLDRFEAATSKPLDTEARQILADVIKGMMESDKM